MTDLSVRMATDWYNGDDDSEAARLAYRFELAVFLATAHKAEEAEDES